MAILTAINTGSTDAYIRDIIGEVSTGRISKHNDVLVALITSRRRNISGKFKFGVGIGGR